MAPTKTIFQFSKQPSWLENMAVRSSGNLLVTRMDVPELWEIDPTTGEGRSIISIPSVSSLTGINELSDDIFAIGGGDYNFATGAVAGSYGLWVVDLTGPTPVVREVVSKMPDVALLNGTATLDASTVLAADSTNGIIFQIDVETGSYSVWLDDPALKPAPEAPFPLGVNGIKIHDNYAYFTNTTQQTVFRILLDENLKPSGSPETVVSGFLQDDCFIDAQGTLFVVTHPTNMVMRVRDGEAEVIAGDYTSMDVAGGTACALGRGSGDTNVLYVCTSGANAMPVNGQTEPAKVVAITL
jgi:sugar lactone lactonase YvrE